MKNLKNNGADSPNASRMLQSWADFRRSGSVADYLRYRSCCRTSEGELYADTSDRQGRRPS